MSLMDGLKYWIFYGKNYLAGGIWGERLMHALQAIILKQWNSCSRCVYSQNFVASAIFPDSEKYKRDGTTQFLWILDRKNTNRKEIGLNVLYIFVGCIISLLRWSKFSLSIIVKLYFKFQIDSMERLGQIQCFQSILKQFHGDNQN